MRTFPRQHTWRAEGGSPLVLGERTWRAGGGSPLVAPHPGGFRAPGGSRGGFAVRPGFTLFEVILAIALSVVLVSALYLTLNMHFQYARSGREIVNETTVTRLVLKRISQDIDCQLSALDPRLQGKQKGSGGGSGSGNPSGQNSSPDGGSGNPSSGSPSGSGSPSNNSSTPSSSSGSPTSSSGNNAPGNQVVFNIGVYGDSNNLVLTGRGVPKDLTLPSGSNPTLTSDLRRVTYWLVAGKGLARQETTVVTGTDVTSSSPPAIPPSVSDPEPYIIAPEVKSFSLEYYDGSTWQSSWDGTTTDSTTGYPIGPPMAIAVTITLEIPSHGGGKPKQVTRRHVVAIPTANSAGQSQPQPITPTQSQ